MNHLLIAPVVLPATLAPLLILALRYHLDIQRVLSVAGSAALVVISVMLLVQTSGGEVQVYELGNWPAPFGIVLVLDRLSALMVTLTSVLGLAVVLYAIGSRWDARGRHFHPLFHFQLMGVCGAFLTGDAFNLFVFFEVLLIASYGLMIHGGGAARLRAGFQYVVYNLLGSTLFLFALGTIYAVTGTLNMADLAVRVAELPPGDAALIKVGGVLLLMVFAVKAALLPLHFWLPDSYANAPAPVAALFAIMTKVGAYSILRMHTLVFAPNSPEVAGLVDALLPPAALLTLAIGAAGTLGASHMMRMVAFGAIGSMGTLLIAVSMATPEATTAALYYMIHSTFATAAMFLVADLVIERRGAGGALIPGPRMKHNGLLASLFFVAAIALAGMPPLSGFIGKLLVMEATGAHPINGLIWAVILIGSFLMILGFARAGSMVFWRRPDDASEATAPGVPTGATESAWALTAVLGVMAVIVIITVLAGPVGDYLQATAAQLYAPDAYIEAVLGER